MIEPAGSRDSVALRRNVKENPADEFRQRELHESELFALAADAEGHGPTVESADPLILDGPAADVARQVGGDAVAVLVALPDIDDPLFATSLVDAAKGVDPSHVGRQLDPTVLDEVLQGVAESSSKTAPKRIAGRPGAGRSCTRLFERGPPGSA